MKKIIIIITIFTLIFFSISKVDAKTKKVSITIGAGVRGVSADYFSDIFSGTNLCYSIDIAYKIMKSGELFLHSDYLALEGETTYTKEKTTFTLTPIEFGFRFLLGKKKFVPYIGLGGGSYSYEDVHPGLLTVSESKVGFFGEGGLKFYVSKSIFIDMKLKYIMLKSEKDIDLGGLAYMAGIGFRF